MAVAAREVGTLVTLTGCRLEFRYTELLAPDAVRCSLSNSSCNIMVQMV